MLGVFPIFLKDEVVEAGADEIRALGAR